MSAGYIVKKFVMLIFTLFIISIVSFIAFQIIPGDAAISQAGTSASPETIAKIRHELGLDAPAYERYINWLLSFFKGDMGISYNYKVSVGSLISSRIPVMITMVVMSFTVIVAFSVVLSVLCVYCSKGVFENAIMVLSQILMSIPGFFLGIMITLVAGHILKAFIPGGYISFDNNPRGFLFYMIFPSIAIAIPKTAMSTKLLISSLEGEFSRDYIRTAKSRGLCRFQVIMRHALKNALLPAITFWGMTIADIVANSLIIEKVFVIPGMGVLLIQSISGRDFPVVQAILVMLAAMIVIINFFVDILYNKIDSRTAI